MMVVPRDRPSIGANTTTRDTIPLVAYYSSIFIGGNPMATLAA